MIRCSTFSCAPRGEPHLCLVDGQFRRRIEKNIGEVSCSMLETSNGDNLKHSQLLDYCWSGESFINVLEWAFCCRCGNVWLRLWETIYHVQMTRTVANKDISKHSQREQCISWWYKFLWRLPRHVQLIDILEPPGSIWGSPELNSPSGGRWNPSGWNIEGLVLQYHNHYGITNHGKTANHYWQFVFV